MTLTGDRWLNEAIKNISISSSLELPMKSDGSFYKIEESNNQQRSIILKVLRTVTAWMDKSTEYKPLRLTVTRGLGEGNLMSFTS
jgi:hypothetical protein